MTIDIKELTNKKIWLAPLAGITDNPFRTICKECGADVVVSEMISVDGLLFNRDKSLNYADFEEFQRPFGLQLFGSDPEIFEKAIPVALERNPDFIDINMGCPVKKVIKRGAGSALMKTPEIAEEIVKTVKKILEPLQIPLSVKFRAGWDMFSINSNEFGKRMQDAGADMICLHPRTRSQMFSGVSNWKLIAELKKVVDIPIIGNGDIRTVDDLTRMLQQTNCDAVMIGRGAMGKPWLFTQIKNYLATGIIDDISAEKKLEIIRKHMELMIEKKGTKKAIIEMRTHFNYYTKGFKGGAKIRNKINHSFYVDEILEYVEELYKRNSQEN